MHFEDCWKRFKELIEEKSYRACLEFEDILRRACSVYQNVCNTLGYNDLINLYFTIYYSCEIMFFEDNVQCELEPVEIDDYFITIEKHTYNDKCEIIDTLTLRFPKIFFNTVQFNKWKLWAEQIALERLTKEKEYLLKSIELYYTKYKDVEKRLKNFTLEQP